MNDKTDRSVDAAPGLRAAGEMVHLGGRVDEQAVLLHPETRDTDLLEQTVDRLSGLADKLDRGGPFSERVSVEQEVPATEEEPEAQETSGDLPAAADIVDVAAAGLLDDPEVAVDGSEMAAGDASAPDHDTPDMDDPLYAYQEETPGNEDDGSNGAVDAARRDDEAHAGRDDGEDVGLEKQKDDDRGGTADDGLPSPSPVQDMEDGVTVPGATSNETGQDVKAEAGDPSQVNESTGAEASASVKDDVLDMLEEGAASEPKTADVADGADREGDSAGDDGASSAEGEELDPLDELLRAPGTGGEEVPAKGVQLPRDVSTDSAEAVHELFGATLDGNEDQIAQAGADRSRDGLPGTVPETSPEGQEASQGKVTETAADERPLEEERSTSDALRRQKSVRRRWMALIFFSGLVLSVVLAVAFAVSTGKVDLGSALNRVLGLPGLATTETENAAAPAAPVTVSSGSGEAAPRVGDIDDSGQVTMPQPIVGNADARSIENRTAATGREGGRLVSDGIEVASDGSGHMGSTASTGSVAALPETGDLVAHQAPEGAVTLGSATEAGDSGHADGISAQADATDDPVARLAAQIEAARDTSSRAPDPASERRVTTLEEKVSELETRLAGIEGFPAKMEARHAEVRESIAAADGRIDGLETSVETLAGVLGHFAGLQDEMDEMATVILDMAERMADVEARNPADRDETESAIKDLRQDVDRMSMNMALIARMMASGTFLDPSLAGGFRQSFSPPTPDLTNSGFGQVPDDVAKGDFVEGYGYVLDVLPAADGKRLTIMENGSVFK